MGRTNAKRTTVGGRKAIGSGAELRRWATVGVIGTSVLSAGLNGLAFGSSAPWPVAGWALGLAIPALTYVFARVAGLLWASGRRRLALAGGAACLAVVGLSVSHLASSIGRLTGESGAGPLLMAVAVDVGLVVCELATLQGGRRRAK